VNHYNLGVDYQDRGRFLEAAREYRRAVELNPHDPAPRFNLGVLYQDHEKPAEAKREYQTLLEKHPDYSPAWVNLAAIQEQEGDLLAAEGSLDNALAADRDNPFPVSQKGFFLLRRARLPEARSAFEEALKRDPKWANAHFGLGRIAEEQGDRTKALGLYLTALDHNPMDLEAHLKAAGLLIPRGQADEAVQHLRRAAELGPTRGETFFLLGALLREKGMWKAAEEAFQRALHLRANPAQCHLELSRIYERLAMEERLSYEREQQRSGGAPASPSQTPPVPSGAPAPSSH
jgi:tetratricopeptide (TPR) repeat protein